RVLSLAILVPVSLIAVYFVLLQSHNYYTGGLIDKYSRKWIVAWRNYNGENSPSTEPEPWTHLDRALFRKYIKSCRPITIQLGSWGSVKAGTSLKVVGKIIVYTNKVTLTLRRRLY